MTKSIRSKLASLIGLALVATSLVVAASTGVAAADNVSATAQGFPALGAPCTVTGTPAGVTYAPGNAADPCAGTEIPLPNPPIAAGVVGNAVFADTNGHSAACAGLLAQGANLQLGDPVNQCVNTNPTGGVSLNINGLATLSFDAVFAECKASATGVSGRASVLNNVVLSVLQPLPLPPVPLGSVLDASPNATPVNLGGLVTVTLNKQTISPDGSRIDVTALRVDLLGLSIEIGKVSCSVDDVNNDAAFGSFDASGDVTAPATSIQPGTRNALAVTFRPGGNRNNVTGIIRLGTGVTIDRDRANNPATRTAPFGPGGPFQTTGASDGLTTGCTYIDSVADPRIECAFGNLTGGTNPVVTVPVVIADNAPNPIEASVQLRASTTNPVRDIFTGRGPVANNDRGPLFNQGPLPANAANTPADRVGLIQAPLFVEETRTEGNPGGTINVTDIRLPSTIDGQIYLDVPSYVTAANYGTTVCDILTEPVDPTQHLQPTAYPENPDAGFTRFNCGESDKATAAAKNLLLSIAPGTPATASNQDAPVGRIVIVRRVGFSGNNNTFITNPAFTPPQVQENSYYSNLFLRVTGAPTVDTDPSGVLTASVSPVSRPAPGGDFTYTVNVFNNSGRPETLTTLTQSINGAAATSLNGVGNCTTGQTIATGATYTCSFVDALTGATGATEAHTFAATVSDSDETAAVAPVTATAVIGDGRTLSVVKSAASTIPSPGGDVTYTVTITNPNPVNVTINSITDKVGNGAPITLAGDDDCKVGTQLTPAGTAGATCSFTFKLPLTGAVGTSQTDVVTVEVTPVDGPKFPTSSTPVTVTISEPSPLDVTLTADPTSLPEPGGKVKFTLNAKNLNPAAANGANDLKITSLKVTFNPTVDAKSLDESTCDVGATIKPGEAGYTCTFTAQITGNAGNVFPYTATGIATNPAGASFTDSGTASVTLTNVQPSIDAKLTVDPAARKTPGGDFTWTLTVTNTSKASSDPVTITSLKNDLLADIEADPNCKKLIGVTLDVGKSASCSFVTKVEGPDGKVTTDLAVVAAKDDEDTPTSDFAVASVSLTAADAATPPTTPTTTGTRNALPKTGASSRTTAAAAMLFAGLGLVLTGGGMQQAPELAVEGKRRRRR